MRGGLVLPLDGKFPSTRYAGSKRRLLFPLFHVFQGLKFETALDLFSGTASVAYLLKKMRKRVIADDYLWSNYWTAVALIENNDVTLSDSDISFVLGTSRSTGHSDFVATTFRGFYFTDEENSWLDACRQNIFQLGDQYTVEKTRLKQAIALHALFQSALRKRPFNMFHRRNLHLRLATVKRQFGNAATWSKPFNEHWRELALETNSLVFSNGLKHKAYRQDAIDWESAPRSDLVYMDPPYVWQGASEAEVDYVCKYHFLEGLARYEEWPAIIDRKSALLQVRDGYKPWPGSSLSQRSQLRQIFAKLVERHHNRTIVLSYREPGVPTIPEILDLLSQYKRHVYMVKWPYRYALRKPQAVNGEATNEIIVVGVNDDYSGPGTEVR